MDWAKVSRKTGVKWLFNPVQSQWRNGKTEAVVKCCKHSLKTTFRHVNFDFFDFTTCLKEISFMLNSHPVELLLGVYSRGGGGQEVDSSLPDMLIGSGSPGSMKTNHSPDTGPRRLEKI